MPNHMPSGWVLPNGVPQPDTTSEVVLPRIHASGATAPTGRLSAPHIIYEGPMISTEELKARRYGVGESLPSKSAWELIVEDLFED